MTVQKGAVRSPSPEDIYGIFCARQRAVQHEFTRVSVKEHCRIGKRHHSLFEKQHSMGKLELASKQKTNDKLKTRKTFLAVFRTCLRSEHITINGNLCRSVWMPKCLPLHRHANGAPSMESEVTSCSRVQRQEFKKKLSRFRKPGHRSSA